MDTIAQNSSREYGLDWVRVGAFALLIFYHSGMFFVTWDFHFKNSDTSKSMEIWMMVMNQWRLPLLFFISGAGISFALKRRTGWTFTRERFKRLFIPIVFGMLVIIPPQIYMERLFKGEFTGSYLEFYPTVFHFVPYPEGGSLSWHHLWFVVYLFFYSLIALPLFLYLKSEKGRKNIDKMVALLKQKTTLYLMALPIALFYFTLSPVFESTHGLFDDWFNHAFFITVFIYGYVLTSDKRILEIVKSRRRTSFIIALCCTTIMLIFFWLPNRDLSFIPGVEKSDIPDYGSLFFIYLFLKSLNLWCCILAIIGYALRYLSFSSPLLRYTNEAVYPFYILHQSVMMVIGYYIIQWDMGVVGKFFAVAVGMFVITTVLYEFVVRRWVVTRFLLGMKSTGNNHAEKPHLSKICQVEKSEELKFL